MPPGSTAVASIASNGGLVPGVGTNQKLYPSGRAGPLPAASTTTKLNDLAQPLIESFNYMLDDGLKLAVADLPAREVTVSTGETLHFWIEDVQIGKPTKSSDGSVSDPRLFPAECRERGLTYAAPVTGTLCRRIGDDGELQRMQVRLGDMPIMVRSSRCHLAGMNPAQLVNASEEAVEFGGYFICNGIERIIRMLQIPKRNYPMAITRSAYCNRGPLYSNKGVMIRCTRPDQSSVSLTLHYLTDGSCTVRFAVKKQEFFLPAVLVMAALTDTNDRNIYERVLAGERGNTYLSDRVLMLLRDAKKLGPALSSRAAALTYLGARFRAVIDLPAGLTDAQCGQVLLDRYVLVHLGTGSAAGRDKANLLILMLRKLYGFVAGRVAEDNADALTNQELLLGGHLLLMMVKEKLDEWCMGIADAIRKEDQYYTRQIRAQANAGAGAAAKPARQVKVAAPVNLRDPAWFRKIVDRQPEVGRKVSYLLATGNLISSSGLDLMQVSGYTVVADKINFMRFTTHFRSVHRGQFFAEMKTTTVRRLLPENWGFLCPVHTPDGGPCGLLNHLSAPCSVVAQPLSDADYVAATSKAKGKGSDGSKPPFSVAAGILQLLVALGMTPHASLGSVLPADELPVLLDGKVLGSAPPHAAYAISTALRRGKALTAAVRAGLERVGNGPLPNQAETVANLTRAAVIGKTDTSRGSNGVGMLHLAANGDGPASSLSLPVPPSLEVAFIPPAWWEPEVDAQPAMVQDTALAQARATRCALLAGSAAGNEDGAASGSAGQGARAGPADDDVVPPTRVLGPFPGLFLSTAPQRPVRPVLQLSTGLVELVSPLEQPYLDIAIWPKDLVDVLQQDASAKDEAGAGKKDKKAKAAKPGQSSLTPGPYSHIELSPTAMLSEVAQLTPFSDMNQSPRNMYQCQMGKQTMGTPLHAYGHRSDTKLFRLITPQAAIVQNQAQAAYGFDEYPAGTNACVAVIAYTGYDMEDACIVNKGSFERGFGWAAVYKTYEVDLAEKAGAGEAERFVFHNSLLQGEMPPNTSAPGEARDKDAGPKRAGDLIFPGLDSDGLPAIGTKLEEGTPMYAFLDRTTKTHRVARHKELEPAFVDEIRVLSPSGNSAGTMGGCTRVAIKLRFDRRPVVGDKFSSRHGQKGVLSFLWPSEDMPFTDAGMVPDVIINPHAFPSRMTIGMLVESMAGKAGALHGRFQDATPFRFDEGQRALDYFGDQLRQAGYAYGGSETMYSGVTGEPLPVDIYYGVVYYQRLRHMVKDKAQVRSTGPTNALTSQPVKGRKKGGGIRFGEMERDSLLAHGTAFLLHDRLHSSSDRHIALVCGGCGSLLAPHSVPATTVTIGPNGPQPEVASGRAGSTDVTRTRRVPVCRSCGTGAHVKAVPMPYVFRYLANELAAMGVRMVLELGEGPYATPKANTAAKARPTMELTNVKEASSRLK